MGQDLAQMTPPPGSPSCPPASQPPTLGLAWVLFPWVPMTPSLALATLLEWPRAYARPLGLGTSRWEPWQPADVPGPEPPLPCGIWGRRMASSWQGGVREGNSCVLVHGPLSPPILPRPVCVCYTGVRPSATERSVCAGGKDGEGAAERGWVPLLPHCAAGHPGTQALRRGSETTPAYLLGRSQSVPPTSAACRSSCPLPPFPVGRGGGKVGWVWSGLGLGAEGTGRASVSASRAKPGWLVSSPRVSQRTRAVLA